SGLDFKVSSRGWAYILEEHGLTKGDFDAAERLITDCRKKGHLPVDFCAEDEGRSVDHLEEIDHETVEAFAQGWVDYLADAHEQYTPFSFCDDLDVYVQMTVEKIDLKNLFSPECARFHIATTNVSGWNDINRRVQIMQRFAHWERQGKKCVLLHCGDHDPGGLQISAFLRSNLEDLAKAAVRAAMHFNRRGKPQWQGNDIEPRGICNSSLCGFRPNAVRRRSRPAAGGQAQAIFTICAKARRTRAHIAHSAGPGDELASALQPFANWQVEHLQIGMRRSVISPQLKRTWSNRHEHRKT